MDGVLPEWRRGFAEHAHQGNFFAGRMFRPELIVGKLLHGLFRAAHMAVICVEVSALSYTWKS
jgi:hypothetical protein